MEFTVSEWRSEYLEQSAQGHHHAPEQAPQAPQQVPTTESTHGTPLPNPLPPTYGPSS